MQHVEDSQLHKNFTFKCHRDGSDVYPVNDISFHPQHGTFVTAGSDGAPTTSGCAPAHRASLEPAQLAPVMLLPAGLQLGAPAQAAVAGLSMRIQLGTEPPPCARLASACLPSSACPNAAAPISGSPAWLHPEGPPCALQDKDSKQRLKAMARCSQPLLAGSFSPDGVIYAYASCYDWGKGARGSTTWRRPRPSSTCTPARTRRSRGAGRPPALGDDPAPLPRQGCPHAEAGCTVRLRTPVCPAHPVRRLLCRPVRAVSALGSHCGAPAGKAPCAPASSAPICLARPDRARLATRRPESSQQSHRHRSARPHRSGHWSNARRQRGSAGSQQLLLACRGRWLGATPPATGRGAALVWSRPLRGWWRRPRRRGRCASPCCGN